MRMTSPGRITSGLGVGPRTKDMVGFLVDPVIRTGAGVEGAEAGVGEEGALLMIAFHRGMSDCHAETQTTRRVIEEEEETASVAGGERTCPTLAMLLIV